METYARNELTEEEALRLIKESMHISDREAVALLGELYASILRRTPNGLAFQARSFGEYLAAEALEDERLERIRELAFLDPTTPNPSWLNAISFLAELHALVRSLFVRQRPLWMLQAPAAFSVEERNTIVSIILQTLQVDGQYVTEHPQIQLWRLARFITDELEATLIENLQSTHDIVRGNAVALLGMRKRTEVLPVALALIKDSALAVRLRTCGLVAILNAGGPQQVEELLPLLDAPDPLVVNLIDMVGAIADENQLSLLLPRILQTDAMLSATYYHFRELKSRSALVEILRYFIAHPSDLNSLRAEGYVEPVLRLTLQYWDKEIANLYVDLIETVGVHHIYSFPSGVLPKLLAFVRQADRRGLVARVYFERQLSTPSGQEDQAYYIDQAIAGLLSQEAAHWLVETGASALRARMAPFVRGEVREIWRSGPSPEEAQ